MSTRDIEDQLKDLYGVDVSPTIIANLINEAIAEVKAGQSRPLKMGIPHRLPGCNEGAKFWLSALTQLKNHGVQAILMACVDGLTGFPEAMNSACPQSSGPALHRPYGFEGNLFCQHR